MMRTVLLIRMSLFDQRITWSIPTCWTATMNYWSEEKSTDIFLISRKGTWLIQLPFRSTKDASRFLWTTIHSRRCTRLNTATVVKPDFEPFMLEEKTKRRRSNSGEKSSSSSRRCVTRFVSGSEAATFPLRTSLSNVSSCSHECLPFLIWLSHAPVQTWSSHVDPATWSRDAERLSRIDRRLMRWRREWSWKEPTTHVDNLFEESKFVANDCKKTESILVVFWTRETSWSLSVGEV